MTKNWGHSAKLVGSGGEQGSAIELRNARPGQARHARICEDYCHYDGQAGLVGSVEEKVHKTLKLDTWGDLSNEHRRLIGPRPFAP